MPPSADQSVLDVLETVQSRFPGVPFLALGQTVLWDEPTKAVWRRLLDEHLPGAAFVAGVHDTDYFAKTVAQMGAEQPYVSLPHDDGRTRDLWSAAGELSCLFGSESVPTRHMFLGRGVPFDWLAVHYPGGKDALYADKTGAWGWRGVVSTESHSVIAHDVPLLRIKDALLEQMDWGFAESVSCLEPTERQMQAAAIAAQIRGWVTEYLSDCSENCRLSDLYQSLLPRLYSLLLQSPPQDFTTSASSQLFRFNSSTYSLPRFGILQTFLDPATRATAKQAYDKAVGGSGSGIYTLDEFGPGAIPFDVVIAGRGRGTLRLSSRGVTIETAPTPTVIPCGPITTLLGLATELERAFGGDVILVGKAVTLIDMVAAEFLVVFHETASGYTGLTRTFNQNLANGGVAQPLYPLVRLSLETWDGLASVSESTQFRLPPHLAATFGTTTLSAPAFARSWRGVVETQRALLSETKSLGKLRDLLAFLEARQSEMGEGECWCDRLSDYEQSLGVLKGTASHSETLRDREEEHRRELALWKEERQQLEQRKGHDWRTSVQPLRTKLSEATAHGADARAVQRDLDRQLVQRGIIFDEPLRVCIERIQATQSLLTQFRKQRRLLERSEEALAARARIDAITRDAQMARLDMVRNAFLTIEGLEHTNLRPTAWWLPLVDPDGAWFRAIVMTAKARFEPLA